MVISFLVRFDRNFYYVYFKKQHSLLLIHPSIVFENHIDSRERLEIAIKSLSTPLCNDTTVPVRLTVFQQHMCIYIIDDRAFV